MSWHLPTAQAQEEEQMKDLTTPTQKWVREFLGTQAVGTCPTCRQALPEGSCFRAFVRYGDGDDLVAYTKTRGEALAVLIGWRDDECGDSFWADRADTWENLSVAQAVALEHAPDALVVAANADDKAYEELLAAVEYDLIGTPLVGAVWVDDLTAYSGR